MEYNAKEEYASRAMGKKCVNCNDYIALPEFNYGNKEITKCSCDNPCTAQERLLSMFPVVTYKMGGAA